ncbi:transcription factor bHLH113-like isoform X1 [Zingiber officinale]|uniref:BHLH domain-containing protein n=1 Tax=Zingiber officinale TaxID=94328 RepID=A0A8J5HGA3_ZINOF|nr:transcription factor bHLH113-like isoform X1 [Zingiber officinale]KAG6515690.1 hypothetical protein ZIOFF_026119 [Zingiber officinale]
MHSIFHEGIEASIASSSPLLPSSSWWPPPVSSSSWSYQWQPPPPPPPPCGPVVVANLISSPSSYDEPSMDDSSADLPTKPVAENHLWNQVLVDDVRGVFEPTTAFDYLKKMDSNWELNLNPNSSLSWFIAPPVPCHDQKASTSGCFFHEANAPWSLSDGIPFDGCSDAKRSTARSGQGKKKRSEETAESLKKSKCGSSSVSSQKMQVPKAKIAEKISALQQIVSPFGKTDQASVLMETITYIRILQEQVQLLSDPYLRSSAIKGQDSSWDGEMETTVESEAYELRSKGLCLVPVSSIPPLESESNGPGFWMPAFHSCLY